MDIGIVKIPIPSLLKDAFRGLWLTQLSLVNGCYTTWVDIQGDAKKYPPNVFWEYFPNDWHFKITFYMPLVCSCLCKITKFYSVIFNKVMPYQVQSSTEFLHFPEKCEKLWYRSNSTTDLHKIWRDDTERVSEVCRPLKNFILKSKMVDRQYAWETHTVSSGDIAIRQFPRWRLSSWNFKIEMFNSQSLQRHVLHYHIKFCGDCLNCCSDIAFFRVFQLECKNSLDDCI